MNIPMTSAMLLMSLVFAFSACRDNNIDGNDESAEKHKVCILTYTSPEDEQMKREVFDYAVEQFNEAQRNLPQQLDISARFVSTDDPYFDGNASNYMLSGKYNMIITPDDNNSKKVESLLKTARNCFGTSDNVPGIIIPTLTSTDVVRQASNMSYVRILTPDGRGQIAAAVKVAYYSAVTQYVFLLYSDDDYGNTYSKFFGQYASEIGNKWVGDASAQSEVQGLIKIKAKASREEVVNTINQAYDKFCKNLIDDKDSCLFYNFIVASTNPEHGLVVDSMRYAHLANDPRTSMTRIILLNRQNGLKHADSYHDAITFTLSPSPENDFANDFKERFGRYPMQGEAYFYDAVIMALYGEYMRMLNNTHLDEGETPMCGGSVLNYMHVSPEDVGVTWKAEGISRALKTYSQGKIPKVKGASSDWEFGNDTHCATRCYYSLSNWRPSVELSSLNADTPLLWASSNPSDRTWYYNDGLLENKWEAVQSTIVDVITCADRDFGELKERWALLIAGTKAIEGKKWGVNYRHQADVWNMYHLLRNHGYAEDHIIVVTEDDIFGLGIYGEGKDEKVVKRSHYPGEPNLYEQIDAHYKLSDISQHDIIDILLGHKSDRLPYVIESTDADNIFIYWSGHGNSEGNLRWDGADSEKGTTLSGLFAPLHLQEPLTMMQNYVMVDGKLTHSEFRFRRLMFVLESCYGGKFIANLPPIEGMLYFSAAEKAESSWADENNIIQIDGVGQINRFDRFSSNFIRIVEEQPKITLFQLYNELYDRTPDSHPMMFNNVNYGSLNHLNFTDYRTP